MQKKSTYVDVKLYCKVLQSQRVHYLTFEYRIYFFVQTTQLLFLLISCGHYFEGGVYFLRNSADIKEGWIRHVWTIQLWLLGTVTICAASQSCCQKRSRTTQTAPVLARWRHTDVCCLTYYTSRTHMTLNGSNSWITSSFTSLHWQAQCRTVSPPLAFS